jgi:hypothetical protein
MPAFRRSALGVLLAVPLVLLAACTSGTGGGSAAGSPSSAAAGPSGTSTPPDPSAPPGSPDPTGGSADDLRIELDRGDGSPVERYRLTCGDVAEGTLPDAVAACAHLASMPAPFAPLPADVMCSQVYGGPQTAHVTGRWHGSPVDLRLSRTDGCRTAQWASLGPLLPGPAR